MLEVNRHMIKNLFRNKKSIMYNVHPTVSKKINVEYCNRDKNIGDLLSKTVVDFMLELKGIEDYSCTKTTHFFAVGSIIDFGSQDCVIWGSGLLNSNASRKLTLDKKIGRKMDIRCIRGPYTRQLLQNSGYVCPPIYGDPVVLLPLFYDIDVDKEYEVSVVGHIDNNFFEDDCLGTNVNFIDVQTDNYKKIVVEIKKSKKIVSASLHGIIIAETYGVPAVLYGKTVMNEIMKYYDWYESTGRKEFPIASSIGMALKMEPIDLPDLKDMRENLLNTFPYDLFLK